MDCERQSEESAAIPVRTLLATSLLILFVMPLLVLLSRTHGFAQIDWPSFWPVAEFTFIQALISGLAAFSLGAIGAIGLLRIQPGRARSVVEIVCLIPNLVPALFVVLACLNFFHDFPQGLAGIVLVNAVMNTGLLAVALAHLFDAKVGRLAELALIEGAGFSQFAFAMFGYLKRDFLLLFLFVFAICFTGFAVPLLVGGYHGVTIEVLIYQTIRVAGNWPQALTLASIQAVILVIASLVLLRLPNPVQSRASDTQIIGRILGLVAPLLASGIVITGLLGGLGSGWRQFEMLSVVREQMWPMLLGSALISIGCGIFVWFFCVCSCFCFPNRWLESFFLGYIAPSAVITGFGILLLPGSGTIWIYMKIALGIALLIFPALYRLGWNGQLDGLRGQIQTARSLGASPFQIFGKVVWPQIQSHAFWLAGLAALWATGDFVISSIISGREITLGMLIEDLLNGYHFELAVLLVWPLLALGVLVYLAFWGMSFVARRKSYS